MTLKQFIFVVSMAATVCWIGWVFVLFKVDPESSGFFGFGLFYSSLFLALLGSFFLLTFAVRKIFNKAELDYKMVKISFRQSFFFAGLLILVLYLQSVSLLAWWSVIFIVIGLTLLEMFFLSAKKA